MPRNRSIPQEARRQVLTEAGFRCAVPTCRTILALDLHHIVSVSEDGGDDPGNLIALCPTCHALYHRGEIPQEAIRSWKGMLVALNFAFDHETIDLLLFLKRISNESESNDLVMSGDGVLKFARLIGAGLARHFICWRDPFGNANYKVDLTRVGYCLIDAWMCGDRLKLEEVLANYAGLGSLRRDQ